MFKSFTLFSFLKGRQTLLSNSESIESSKNVIDFYFRKLNLISKLNFRCRIKSLHIDPVFPNGANFITKSVNIHFSSILKNFQGIYFLF